MNYSEPQAVTVTAVTLKSFVILELGDLCLLLAASCKTLNSLF